jgi:hypothetical protein
MGLEADSGDSRMGLEDNAGTILEIAGGTGGGDDDSNGGNDCRIGLGADSGMFRKSRETLRVLV